MTASFRTFSLLTLALLCAGCAGQSTRTQSGDSGFGPITSSTNYAVYGEAVSSAAELEHVPHFPQDYQQCGPSALAALLVSAGQQTSPEELKSKVYTPGKGGSLAIELKAQIRQHDLLAIPVQPTIAAIVAEVAAGRPVIVMQNLGLKLWPYWHFAVVAGYNLGTQTLILRSANTARLEVPFSLFEKTWDRADNWAYVAITAGDSPGLAQRETYNQAALELEQIGKQQQALGAYLYSIETWPENPIARMGAGNIELSQGNTQKALKHYQSLLKQTPKFAPAWNNQAYALKALGCPEQAVASAQCAVKADKNPVYQSTLDELSENGEMSEQGDANESLCQVTLCTLENAQQ